ncbi:hypothetical protein REPUB_Repub19eG0038000 [Reevesia pubescens]
MNVQVESSKDDDSGESSSETSSEESYQVQSSGPYTFVNASPKTIRSEAVNDTNPAHSKRTKSIATRLGEKSGENPSNEKPVTGQDKNDAKKAASEASNSNSDSVLVGYETKTCGEEI